MLGLKNKLNRKTMVVFLVLAALAAGWLLKKQVTQAKTSSAILVEAATVKEGTIQDTVTVLGSLSAQDSVVISPAISAHIAWVNHALFDAGQEVPQGAELVKLDDSLTLPTLNMSKAALANSQDVFESQKKLLAKGATSQQQYNLALSDLKTKEAAFELAQATEDKMTLKAPIAGYLTPIAVSAGNYVTVGQALATLVDKNHLRVDYYLPQADLSTLQLGQTVTLKVNAYPGEVFAGHVVVISPEFNSESRDVLVQAVIDNSQHKLRPGMFGDLTQQLGEVPNQLIIPEESLVPSITGKSVYKIIHGQKKTDVLKTILVTVNVEHRYDKNVAIDPNGSLKVGDEVVTAGWQKLRDGSVVSVVK